LYAPRLGRAGAAFALAFTALTGLARAEIFVLDGPGEVRGQLLNADESPRKTYVIKTSAGGQVVLDAAAVKDVKRQSAEEMKYDRYRGEAPDTVDGQWKLSEWCRENRLLKQRHVHLERIIELDPNHAEARRGLGYSRVDGRWLTRDQRMIENGYVKSKFVPGKWVLPQEEELLEAQSKSNKSQLEWSNKLKRYSSWLGTDKGAQAVAHLKAINDPAAVRSLAKYLETDNRHDARMLYLEALSRIGSPPAMDVLVATSLFDADDELRLSALDEVIAREYKPAVQQYVKALKHKENPIINRAATGLGRLKDPMAVGPLIDALVSTHTFRIQKGQPGQTSSSFSNGPGGGGFSFGGSSVEIIKRSFENPAVLQALISLTGGTSFNYDVRAWKNWYVAQKKPKTLDARRD
jgi:HEAT repeats